MKPSRFRTLLLSLIAGVAYAFFTMLILSAQHENVSVSYIFILPLVMGAIPVLFSTKEQLQSYKSYIVMPWLIVITFVLICRFGEFDGMICLIIIIAPFLLLGTIGGFIFRLIKLKNSNNKTPLYCSLFLPFLFLIFEVNFPATNQFHTVSTSIVINAARPTVWQNTKNVKNIQPNEVKTHFIHLIGIPKPLNGQLDKDGIGGIRSITWEKGIKFQEVIKKWNEGFGFNYDINVDPKSIPPTTLDEHVMIGGRYFDAVDGSYRILPLSDNKNLITLKCRYRVTTNLNFYSKWWADFILDDFNQMILEVIKERSEKSINSTATTNTNLLNK